MGENNTNPVRELAEYLGGLVLERDNGEMERTALKEVERCWDVFAEYAIIQQLQHREDDLAKVRETREKCLNVQEVRDIRIVLPEYLAPFYKGYVVTMDNGCSSHSSGKNTYGHEIRFSFSDKHDFVMAYMAGEVVALERVEHIFKDAEVAYKLMKSFEKYLPANVRIECIDSDDCGVWLNQDGWYETDNDQKEVKRVPLSKMKDFFNPIDDFVSYNAPRNFFEVFFSKEKFYYGRICRMIVPNDTDMSFLANFNKIRRGVINLKNYFLGTKYYCPISVGLVPVKKGLSVVQTRKSDNL